MTPVLSASSIIYLLAIHANPEGTQVNIINDLQSTAFFVSFATTFATTVLIAYQIHSSAKTISDLTRSSATNRGRFTHIVDVIIQSSAIYSLVLLIAAVSGALPTNGFFPNISELTLSTYSSTLLVPAAGIAPTLMAARVSLASGRSNDDHVVSRSPGDVLSNLRFEGHGGNSSSSHNETHIDLKDYTTIDIAPIENKNSIQV